MFAEPPTTYGEHVLSGPSAPSALQRLLDARSMCMRGLADGAYQLLNQVVIEMEKDKEREHAK